MSPPDTNLNKQKRRHRYPLIGMAFVVLFGVGVILYWIAEEAALAPGPETIEEGASPGDIREGEVQVPPAAPTGEIGPGDPEIEVNP